MRVQIISSMDVFLSLDVFSLFCLNHVTKVCLPYFFGFKYTLDAKLLRLILDNGLSELQESESDYCLGVKYQRVIDV